MTVELVKAIKEAESKAELIIREAQQESRQAQKESEEKAAAILEKALKDAGEKSRDLKKIAEDEARSEAEPLIEERQKEITRLREKASGRLSEAVAVLTDKVVKLDADN